MPLLPNNMSRVVRHSATDVTEWLGAFGFRQGRQRSFQAGCSWTLGRACSFENIAEETIPILTIYGMTSVRDMGGDIPVLKRWRDESESRKLVGPSIKFLRSNKHRKRIETLIAGKKVP